jgi:hypothetical protein
MFLQRSEAAKAIHFVRESTRNNVSTVFWATGTLDGKPQTITIPVDSVTKRITFTFSVDTKGNHLNLTQPSGGAITEGLAGTDDTELNCGRILTVSSPEAGVWHAEITGTGRYWMEAQAQSDIFFVGVEFCEERWPSRPRRNVPDTGAASGGDACNTSGISLRQRNKDHRVLSGYGTGPDHPEVANAHGEF